MINWRLISKITGMLLFIEAGLMVLCQIVAFIYDEGLNSFGPPIAVALVFGVLCLIYGRKAGSNMGRKDGYVVVSIVWVIFTMIGMVPFLVSGTLPDMASAFFETMSGFTSTGATVIDNISEVPHSLLFWRSVTQWIGGIGIVFFTIAILPAFGVGEVKLFACESTGPLHDKVHPRISVAAKWIGSIYLMLTLLCVASLVLCGMDVFDAVNYSMCTTATGGYGTHSEMLHEVFGNSASIEYVLTFFMFVSGINYTLIYLTILKGKLKHFFCDAEVRCYYSIVLSATLICTISLCINNNFSDIELSFRESIFTVVSLQTTTGLATCDYTLWPVQLMPILLFVMFVGASSGSTSGGFKCARISIIYRVLKNEFVRILHPRAVIPVRLNNTIVPHSVVQTLLGFITLFVLGLFGGAFLLAICGVTPNPEHPHFDYYEAFGLALSSISNVGPGMGYYGPAHSWMILSPVAKWICSFLMLIGRLEIFPIIILFTPSFWEKN